jgi:hypothetical protein
LGICGWKRHQNVSGPGQSGVVVGAREPTQAHENAGFDISPTTWLITGSDRLGSTRPVKAWARKGEGKMRPKLRRPIGKAGVLALVCLVASACSSGPIEPLGPAGTVWAVVAIGDSQQADGAITLTVQPPADAESNATILIRTGCRSVPLGLAWDNSDGIWISFALPDPLTSPCSAALASQDRAFFDALSTVETDTADGDTLVLHGNQDIHMKRSR